MPVVTSVTSREEFEKLIDLRLAEAKLLLDHKNWDGAYYLVGYVVEFALKIRIISQLMTSNSFPARSDANDFYQHGLTKLRKLASLDNEMQKDTSVSKNWDIVKDWTEQTRYLTGRTEQEAQNLYDAIQKEVLPWIRRYW